MKHRIVITSALIVAMFFVSFAPASMFGGIPRVAAASFTNNCATPAVPTGTAPKLNSTFTLTVIGSTGTTVTYNQNTIFNLPACWSYGGFRAHASGNFLSDNYGNYTGVPILTLANLVGGISPGGSVTVTSGTDGYQVTYTYQEVTTGLGWGSLYTTATCAKANECSTNGTVATVPMYLVLAYLWNSSAISAYACTSGTGSTATPSTCSAESAGTGPLRTVTLSSTGSLGASANTASGAGYLIGAGAPWNKGVTVVQVNPSPFSSSCTAPTVPSGSLPALNSSFSLNLVGAYGMTATYNQNTILSLPACQAYGGFVAHASGGYLPDDYGVYAGVPMLTLVDLVGGITPGETVTATSGTDGYAVTYTYQEVTSGIGWGSIYTTSTCSTAGACSSSTASVTTVPMYLVLAYLWNDTAISAYTCSVAPSACTSATESAGVGPLRTVTVNPTGSLGASAVTSSGAGYLIGAGAPWNKGVTTIKVNPATNPTTTPVYFTEGAPLASSGVVLGNITWTTPTLQGFQYVFPVSIAINGVQFGSTFSESLFPQYQLAVGNSYAGYYGGTFAAISGCSSGATITLTATVNGVTKTGSAICPGSGSSATINLNF